MPKNKQVDGRIMLLKNKAELAKVQKKIDQLIWTAPRTAQSNAKLKALKRRRDQLKQRYSRILRAKVKRVQGSRRP
jgi:hypothetical protein